jgi:hypothetical protein
VRVFKFLLVVVAHYFVGSACVIRMAGELPCDQFLMRNFCWPRFNLDRVAGRKFELDGMLLLIREYEAEFAMEHPNHCYEVWMWDEPDEGEFVERLMRRHFLPGCFLEEYMGNATIGEICVALDLEVLRRVYRWYMPDVEE